MKRGVTTVADLRARSVVDPATHCWHWKGPASAEGDLRLWTFDYRRGDKGSVTLSSGAFMIAFERAPRAYAYRCCGVSDCVNPAHLREVPNRAAIGRALALSGRLKGTLLEQRRANVAKAHQARGITATPAEVVRAIRNAAPEVLNIHLAAQFGIGRTTVGKIRRGASRVEVSA